MSRLPLVFASRRRGIRCRNCGARITIPGSLLRVVEAQLLAQAAFLFVFIVGVNVGLGLLASGLIGLVVFVVIGFSMEWDAELKVISKGNTRLNKT